LSYPSPLASDAGQAGPTGPVWGLLEVVTAIVIVVVAVVVALASASPFILAFGEDSTVGRFAAAISTTVAEVLAAFVIYVLVLKPKGIGLAELGFRLPRRGSSGARSFSWGWAGTVAAGSVGCFIILIAYVSIVMGIGIDVLEPKDQVPPEFFESPIVIFAIGIGVLLAAPLFEELFFRGFLFPAFRPVAGLLPAAILSGLLFGLVHFQLGLIVPFGLIGATFALLYWSTDSLYTAMGSHFLFNLIGFVALVAREA